LPYKVLIVDDEESIRDILDEILDTLGFETETAQDGIDALEKLEKQQFDMVLSDINMPRMKGFELLKNVRERYPKIKRALITAYNVDDYIDLALKHDVGNIIVKTTPFNIDDIERVVNSMVSEDIFGLSQYMRQGTEIHKTMISDPDDIESLADTYALKIGNSELRGNLKLVVSELLINAIFYGVREEQGDDKENWNQHFKLSPEQAVETCIGIDDEKCGFSVVDNGGKLKKKDVLHWLNRQITAGENGIPVGVLDSHGRGMFLARQYMDSLIINIKPGIRTEIIGILYNDRSSTGHKPLYINEV